MGGEKIILPIGAKLFNRSVLLLCCTSTFVIILLIHFLWQHETLQVASPIKHCPCTRPALRGNEFKKSKSAVCDTYATYRPSGQHVVAYSFYGNSSDSRVVSHYLEPMAQRAQDIKTHYPGWIMRIYYHSEDIKVQAQLCQLWCQNHHVDLCDVQSLPVLGDLKTLQPIGT